jgi:hypothetical protein
MRDSILLITSTIVRELPTKGGGTDFRSCFNHHTPILYMGSLYMVVDLQHALGKLNVRNLETVVANPEEFAEKLRCACTSEGTLKNHISSILCIYKYNPRMKETYPRAFVRSRQIKESRLNAPSNSRQAQNFVPMAEWRVALDLLAKGEDPHSSLNKSQAFMFMSYACATSIPTTSY